MSNLSDIIQESGFEVPEEDWAKTPASVMTLISILIKKIDRLETDVRQLKEENQHLREQLGLNSQNSSKPPSSDYPIIQKREHKSTGKKRGGQPGHKQHVHRLIPTEECSEVIELIPEYCEVCGEKLLQRDSSPERKQVIEIPDIKVHVTEFQTHKIKCHKCHHVNKLELPAEAKEFVGPRLHAFVCLENAGYTISIRQIQQQLHDLFGITLSIGYLSYLRIKVGNILRQSANEVYDYIQQVGVQKGVVHGDETGFRQGNSDGKNMGKNMAWLWAFVTTSVVAFTVSQSRGQDVAKKLLGESFSGVAITDRWGGYNWIDGTHRQLCWAHILRDFQRIAERGDKESKSIGSGLLKEGQSLFSRWHQFLEEVFDWQSFVNYATEIRQKVHELLERGGEYKAKKREKSSRAKTARTCQNLLKMESSMWTFLNHQGVEPTNNLAERMIRPAVIWRNISFGSESEKGSEYVAFLMTAKMTLKRQGRNFFDYLVAACVAARKGERPPSLLPSPTTP